MASKRTKQCRLLKNIFTFLHLICLFGPLLYFIPYAFLIGTPVEKISLSFTVIVALILAVISVVTSVTARAGLQRCMLWSLICGVLFCLADIKAFIYIVAISSVLDELVFVKLKDHYKAALISNKEIDRRAI